MKKLISITLILCISLMLSACDNINKGETVALPIKGHFSVRGDIIVETDKISVTNDVIPNAKAFTYKDGEFYKLKRYETKIIIPQEHTAYADDMTLELQYFICNGTVYAYLNVDRKMLPTYSIEILSIPQNDECIIIQSGEICPLYINLKSGKITPVFDSEKEGSDMPASVVCTSEDGKYAVVLGIRSGQKAQESYIINLGNFKATKIPMCPYNKEFYELKHFYPDVFVDGRVYVNYALTELDIDGGGKVGAFFYDIKKKKSEELAAPLNDYTSIDQFPYIKMKFEQKTGTLKIKNLKDIVDYSFSVYPSNGLWGSPNKTGQYFIGSYFDMPIAGYDENGQPYYENVQQNQKHIVVDVKNQKRIDLSKIDDKFNYKTYDGKSCRYSWISETELIIFCQDGNEEYIQTVINVAEDKK